MTRGWIWMALYPALAGCMAGDGGGEPQDTAASGAEIAGGERAPRWRGHGPGHDPVGGLLLTTLDRVVLRDDQRAKIEGMLEKRGDARDEMREARAEKGTAIVAAVRAGDVAAIRALEAERPARAQAKVQEAVSDLNELHATLDTEQRAVLVQAVRDRFEQHEGRASHRHGHERGHGRGHGRGGIGRLTRDLDLTDEQVARLEVALPAQAGREDWQAKREERRAQKEAMLTAFASDSFDASR